MKMTVYMFQRLLPFESSEVMGCSREPHASSIYANDMPTISRYARILKIPYLEYLMKHTNALSTSTIPAVAKPTDRVDDIMPVFCI